jgi:hypothetical protein
MRPRLVTLLALALAAWPPVAHAAAPSVRVAACSPSGDGEGGAVTFAARMHAVPGTVRMAVRFRLLEKLGDGGFHRVHADGLGGWRRSQPGAGTFVYEQSVRGLRQGGAYRAIVRFRWYGAGGEVIRRARVRSAACRQPGGLPNLRVAGIETRAGEVEETAVYRVRIANRGGSAAKHVGVLLRVDGEVVDEGEVIAALEPGEVRTVTFSGPVCRRQLRVVVDPKELIAESREGDNVRAPDCL